MMMGKPYDETEASKDGAPGLESTQSDGDGSTFEPEEDADALEPSD